MTILPCRYTYIHEFVFCLDIMVNYWRDFESGPNAPEEIYIVTEIQRNTRNKYEYDTKMGVFKLNRVLYTYYPADYGFIPRTLDDDGDPLDAVLLINEPTFTGCVTVARPVANIKMIDEKRQDDKIVAVSTTDPFFKHIKSIDDLPRSVIDELTYFYNNYKRAEGKITEVLKWEDADEAKELIKWAQGQYDEQAE
jgi:inorganic pyrophosphatase